MNFSIKECPDEVYQLIKQKARESGSTINQTVLDILSGEMVPQAEGTDSFLKEVRLTRQKLTMEISEEWLIEAPTGLKTRKEGEE